MTTTPATIDFILEQLAPLGPVHAKRMFGGAGIFCDGMMFALVADDTLYFKADDASRGDYEAEGMLPFSYTTKDGRRTLTSYWRAPERLFDEPDDMLSFARTAIAVARRAAAKSKPKASGRGAKDVTGPAASRRHRPSSKGAGR